MQIGKVIVLGTFVATVLVLLAGCNRSVKVKGEVFTHSRTLVREAGALVYILTERQNARLLPLIEELRMTAMQPWLKQQCQEYTNYLKQHGFNDSMFANTSRTNALLKQYRERYPNDAGTDDEVLLELGANAPQLLDRFPDAKAEYLRLRLDLDMIMNPSDGFKLEDARIKALLEQAIQIVADSEGKFSVDLVKGRTYFVVGVAASRERPEWHFKYTATGQQLILSGSNKR